MSLPATTNSTLTAVNTVIKGIENVCLPLIEAAIIAQVPALGPPVVKQITEEIEQILANYLTKWAEEEADFTIIDGQVAAEESNLSSVSKGANDAAFQAAQSALHTKFK